MPRDVNADLAIVAPDHPGSVASEGLFIRNRDQLDSECVEQRAEARHADSADLTKSKDFVAQSIGKPGDVVDRSPRNLEFVGPAS